MGWSERTTSLKLNSKIPWKQTEIMKAIDILRLVISDEVIEFSIINLLYGLINGIANNFSNVHSEFSFLCTQVCQYPVQTVYETSWKIATGL